MDDEVTLALAMGWRENVPPEAAGWWTRGKQHRVGPPDPFTNANDCNALIKHLNGLGFEVHLMFPSVERKDLKHEVRIYNSPKGRQLWRGDNWMHGVCELALNVLDENGHD